MEGGDSFPFSPGRSRLFMTTATPPASSSSSSGTPVPPPPNNNNNTPLHDFKDIDAYNRAMQELVQRVEQTGEIEYAFGTESMLRRLLEQKTDDDDDQPPPRLVPNTQSYNLAMKAWSLAVTKLAKGVAVLPTNKDGIHHRGGDVYTVRDAVRRVERLRSHLELRYCRGEHDICSDLQTYSLLFQTYNKSHLDDNNNNNNNDGDENDKVATLLRNMERYSALGHPEDHTKRPWSWLRPNLMIYNNVMDAYATSQADQVQKAEEILTKIKANAIEPTAFTYNSLIRAWAKHADAIRQDPTTKNTHNNTSSTRAQELLVELLASYQQKLNDPDDVEHAANDYRPDVATYTSVIDCLAKEAAPGAPDRAEHLLSQLEGLWQRHEYDPAFRPNARTYTAVMNAYARTRHAQAPHRAEELLHAMEQEEEAQPSSLMSRRPSTRTYTVAVSCWARGKDITKPQRAVRLLKRLLARHEQWPSDEEVRPTVYLYNAVIDACAKCPCRDNVEQQRAAFKIAFAVYAKMKLDPSVTPNHVTFTLLMRCVTNLLPRRTTEGDENNDDRNMILKKLFLQAKQEGQLETGVLSAFRFAADADLFVELIGDGEGMVDPMTRYVDYQKIPKEWCKNVSK